LGYATGIVNALPICAAAATILPSKRADDALAQQYHRNVVRHYNVAHWVVYVPGGLANLEYSKYSQWYRHCACRCLLCSSCLSSRVLVTISSVRPLAQITRLLIWMLLIPESLSSYTKQRRYTCTRRTMPQGRRGTAPSILGSTSSVSSKFLALGVLRWCSTPTSPYGLPFPIQE